MPSSLSADPQPEVPPCVVCNAEPALWPARQDGSLLASPRASFFLSVSSRAAPSAGSAASKRPPQRHPPAPAPPSDSPANRCSLPARAAVLQPEKLTLSQTTSMPIASYVTSFPIFEFLLALRPLSPAATLVASMLGRRHQRCHCRACRADQFRDRVALWDGRPHVPGTVDGERGRRVGAPGLISGRPRERHSLVRVLDHAV